ncbi:MAG: hypothetical protein ACQEQH_07505 [Bacillota bacterium]
MALNVIGVIIMSVGCSLIIYFGVNNIIKIHNRKLSIKEQRVVNRAKKVKKKYGKKSRKN